jgi:hypothetical protein
LELESLPAADPAILESLRRWCTATALATGLPPHYVLTRATMEELARRRPKSREALLQVKGIGKAKLDRFGDVLLAILAGQASPGRAPEPPAPPPVVPIEGPVVDGLGIGPGTYEGFDYQPDPFDLANEAPPEAALAPAATQPAWPPGLTELQASAQAATQPAATQPASPPGLTELQASAQAATPAGEKDQVRPNHFWTWRLVTAGFSAAECEVIRGMRREAILDHLSRAIDEGWPVRPAVCFSPQLLAALEQVIGPGRPQQLRPLLARLPEGTRYEEIELFLKCRGRRAEDTPPS